MGGETLFDIAIPEQDLAQFTHFPASAEGAREWASELPVTNIRAVSARLHAALTDLNRYPLRPEIRFGILGNLADYLRVTLTNLTRRFLNQPLVMPAEPQQLAARTDALLAELQTAYSIVAIETQRNQDNIRDTNPARLLCESLYNAVYFTGQQILLAYQLHRPAPIDSWLSLHRLYALGEWQGLEQLSPKGGKAAHGTIASAYLQALILGCCKPNQLLQGDLEAIYRALGQWHDKLKIGRIGELKGLFTVDLASDQPAVYSALYGGSSSPSRRIIDTESLAAHLRSLRDPEEGYDGRGVRLVSGLLLQDSMIAHLMEALGSRSMRNFKRVTLDAPVLVSLGISGAHYHGGGEPNFQQLIYGRDHRSGRLDGSNANPFINNNDTRRDIWDQANPAKYERSNRVAEPEAAVTHNIELDIFTRNVIEQLEVAPVERQAPVHRVYQRNASPGGYCLEWDRDLPEEVRNGEILCIQENPNTNWSIASIRWISRLENSRTLVGVELLSPGATACAIQPQQKIGPGRTPQRALLLPEIPLIGQPPTLVTPRTGFHEGMKATLLRHGQVRHIQLQQQLAATATFVQFAFRDIHRVDDMLAGDKQSPTAVYDSLWGNI